MYNHLRQSFKFSKKILTSKKYSPAKSFSALSSERYNNLNSNYCKCDLFLNKVCKAKHVQQKCFSFDSLYSFSESIRTSDATKFVTHLLIQSHDFTGFTWTATIIAASAVLKLVVNLPSLIYQQHLLSKLEFIKTEIDASSAILKDTVLRKGIIGKWSHSKLNSELRREVNKMRKSLIIAHNCHPLKIPILFIIQFPFWVLLTVSIRNLAMDSVSFFKENPTAALQFQVGGPFWSPNLSTPDPTYILPTINALTLLGITEVTSLNKPQTKIMNRYVSFLNKAIPNFLRLFAVGFFFISASSPSAVSLFWATGSLISMGQNLLFMSPKVRRFLKIPKTSAEVDKPYRNVFNNFLKKMPKFLTSGK